MKLITRDTDYAIRALCHIAKDRGGLISAKELIRCLDMPRPFLRKIMQILNKEGLVRSYRGKNGGFSLAKSPDKITLIDIINIFQGPVELNDHTFKKKPCPNIRSCRLKKILERVEKIVASHLGLITISSILKRKD